MGYELLNTHNYELRICFCRKLMSALSQYQWDQWEIFLLPNAKSDGENSPALGDSKFIPILRQSKQKTQFIEICLESQKSVVKRTHSLLWKEFLMLMYRWPLLLYAQRKLLVSCSPIIFFNKSAAIWHNLAIYLRLFPHTVPQLSFL